MARHPFTRWVLALGAVVLVFYVLAALVVVRTGPVAKDFGWINSPTGPIAPKPGLLIVQVAPNGPAAGRLAPGDRILAVNGDPAWSGTAWEPLFLARPGGSYVLRIARDGAEREVALKVSLRRDLHWIWMTL